MGPKGRNWRNIRHKSVEFLGELDDSVLSNVYAKARALLFAADEDFGLVPLEAQSYGRPVIAFGKGGALETVIGAFVGGVPSGSGSSSNRCFLRRTNSAIP